MADTFNERLQLFTGEGEFIWIADIFFLRNFLKWTSFEGWFMHGTHYLACERALLFGQAKRAARASGSCHVPLARPLFTISSKLRACSKATHSILYGFLFVPNHLLFVSSFDTLLFSFPQRSTQRTIIRDDYGKAVSVEGVTSGSRKSALNWTKYLGFINWLWHVNVLLASNFKRIRQILSFL